MEILVGCDPELFVVQNGQFRSAYGLVPGTKSDPFKVDNGAVQVDGMALEFNIEPARTEDEFVRNVTSVMAQLKSMVNGYEFAIVPSCRFEAKHFNAQPKEAKELGCEPDYNAYTMQQNERPVPRLKTFRTAAGHIHVGFTQNANVDSPDHLFSCSQLVKQLDWYLGLPSVLFDQDVNRRELYGQAGAFRPKPYGAEYRVLSNAWLLSERRMRFVYRMTQKAVQDLIDGVHLFTDETAARNCATAINSSLPFVAEKLLDRYMPDGTRVVREAKAL